MARIKHGSLNNEQVEVDLEDNFRFVEVLMRSGTDALWAVADRDTPGSIAAVDDVDVIPANGTGSVIIESPSNAQTVVRLESPGSVDWSLKGIE